LIGHFHREVNGWMGVITRSNCSYLSTRIRGGRSGTLVQGEVWMTAHPIHVAAMTGNVGEVTKLLDESVDINIRGGWVIFLNPPFDT
jgi:cbb3-type cytochrome oxidase subunit 1